MPTDSTPDPTDAELSNWLEQYEAGSQCDHARALRALIEARREVERLANDVDRMRRCLIGCNRWKPRERCSHTIVGGCAECQLLRVKNAIDDAVNGYDANAALPVACAVMTWRAEPPDREGWWCYRDGDGYIHSIEVLSNGLDKDVRWPADWCYLGPLPAEPPSKETRLTVEHPSTCECYTCCGDYDRGQ